MQSPSTKARLLRLLAHFTIAVRW